MKTETSSDVRVVSSRVRFGQRLKELWRYRELLVGLVRKELKVKYKNSALGFFWSMLNPALYLVVFYIVFQLVLKSGIPNFAIFLLSGLLVWHLFSNGVSAATSSMVDNAGIVKKVAFPREILPLASIGASLVHFFLQSIVLVIALVAMRYEISWTHVILLPFALAVLLTFTAGLGVLFSAINVYFRDVQHFLELALLAWFWMTPIVYQYRLVADRLDRDWLYLLNPITPVVLTFQRAIYNQVEPVNNGEVIHILPDEPFSWYATNLAVLGVFSAALLLFGLWVFSRLEGNFAEEL